jgi:hypothetical protein
MTFVEYCADWPGQIAERAPLNILPLHRRRGVA